MKKNVSYEFDPEELDIILSGLDELIVKYEDYGQRPYYYGAKLLRDELEED